MKTRIVIDAAADNEGKFTVIINKTGVNIFPSEGTDIMFFSADVVPLSKDPNYNLPPPSRNNEDEHLQ